MMTSPMMWIGWSGHEMIRPRTVEETGRDDFTEFNRRVEKDSPRTDSEWYRLVRKGTDPYSQVNSKSINIL